MLPGIDISAWQTATPSLDGLAFVAVRACYGTARDARWEQHSANVRKARLHLIAYCFGRHGDPVAQARALLDAPADEYALDLESDGDHTPMSEAQARAFIAEVHRQGYNCGLYHSLSGFPSLGQDWNWVAAWGTKPPSIPWRYWQWQGTPLDRNWFNGDQTALLRLTGKRVPAPVPASTIARVRTYIRRLGAVARPTAAQRAELAAYRQRLRDFLRRNAR